MSLAPKSKKEFLKIVLQILVNFGLVSFEGNAFPQSLLGLNV